MQVSFTLDNDLFEDIVAKGASMADAKALKGIAPYFENKLGWEFSEVLEE